MHRGLLQPHPKAPSYAFPILRLPVRALTCVRRLQRRAPLLSLMPGRLDAPAPWARETQRGDLDLGDLDLHAGPRPLHTKNMLKSAT